MNLAQSGAVLAMNAYTQLFNGASLTFYSGTQPSTPEQALSGNTALVVFTFTSTPFGAASYSSPNEKQTANFSNATQTPTQTGTASFARATLTASGAWAATHAYTVGTIITNSSNYYICVGAGTSAGSGGPTTTALGIVDGGVTWNYIAGTAGQGNVLADFTVGTSGTDIVVGSTSFSTGISVNLSSFVIELPAV